MAILTYAVIDKVTRLVVNSCLWDADAHPEFATVVVDMNAPNGALLILLGEMQIGDIAP